MNAADARIAAWNIIADQELPAGTKVAVEDGQVTIRAGRSHATVPYTPSDTPSSLHSALERAARTITKGNN